MFTREDIEARFTKKNISGFFESLFNEEHSKSIHSALAIEIVRLLGILRVEYKSSFPESEFLFEKCIEHIIPGSMSLNQASLEILAMHNLKDQYLPAFVSSELSRSSYDKQLFDQYKALTLVVIARLAAIGDHESKIRNVCNEIRMYANGHREVLAAFLPDIRTFGFPELIEELIRLSDEVNIVIASFSVREQVKHYQRPFRDSLKFNHGIKHRAGLKAFRREGRLLSAELEMLDDSTGDFAVEIRQIQYSEKAQEPWQQEENHSGVGRSHSVVTLPSRSSHDYAASVLRARAINSQIRKKEKKLACDIYSSTLYEVNCLVRYCISTMTDIWERGHVQIIIVMLLTGRGFEQVKKLKFVRNGSKVAEGIKYELRLPTQKVRHELSPLVTEITKSYILPLPLYATLNLTDEFISNVDERDIKKHILSVNKKYAIHMSLNKVSGYLSQRMSRAGIDPVLSGLIRGAEPSALTALYYCQTSVSSLLDTYQRYVDHIGTLVGCPDFFKLPGNTENQTLMIGSPLRIEDEYLSHCFHLMKLNIDKLLASDTTRFTSQAHNLIVLYTQFVLGLSSGYRPVTGWYGKLEDIDFHTGEYWISDKERILEDTSRIIVLPDIAVAVLRCFIAYVELANQYFKGQCELGKRYIGVLDSECHLFFYRNGQGFEEATPKSYANTADNVWPLQPNWTRHHIRSYLLEKHTPPDLVAAWMGHLTVGDLPFSRFSSLSRKDLLVVTQTIEEHLKVLGIVTFQ